ncbi:MAG: glycine cleavage system protein GcvH [Alphaproteobacteria bacterium]|nr:glycine cleavage system protein GcvH [Alphaproteobacteria bacterium]NCQ88236.1 glycine cleavage system protein GcvH [Alphaproteobacteria bacterium]NCT05257.1 glycine cleavage system protein GcvH [Alphaproteobacteria bacterium]
MSEVKYTKDHEWLNVDGDTAWIGITTYARHALGDLVFIELPEAGRAVSKGDDFAVVESVKAASEIYTPVTGEITEVNETLADDMDALKEDIATGWIVKVKMTDACEIAGLMDKAAYDEYVAGLE